MNADYGEIRKVTLPEHYAFLYGYLIEFDETISTWEDLINSTEFNTFPFHVVSNPAGVMTYRDEFLWDPIEGSFVCGSDEIINGRKYRLMVD